MPEWKVFVENFNAQKIEPYNIFEHGGFYKDCHQYLSEAVKKKKDLSGKELEEKIRRSLQYYFWSKCEWEIILSPWPFTERVPQIKIDVYDQVMLNWEAFYSYLLAHIGEFIK